MTVVRYIDAASGSDAADGTAGAPWRTIAKAIRDHPGGIAYHAAYDYTTRVEIKPTFDLDPDFHRRTPLTIRPVPGDIVQFRAGLAVKDVWRVRFEALVFRFDSMEGTQENDVWQGCRDVQFARCEIRDKGFAVYGGVERLKFLGCRFHDLLLNTNAGAQFPTYLAGSAIKFVGNPFDLASGQVYQYTNPAGVAFSPAVRANYNTHTRDTLIYACTFSRPSIDAIQATQVDGLFVIANNFTQVRPWEDLNQHCDCLQIGSNGWDSTSAQHNRRIVFARNIIRHSGGAVIASVGAHYGFWIVNNLFDRLGHDPALTGVNADGSPAMNLDYVKGGLVAHNTIANCTDVNGHIRATSNCADLDFINNVADSADGSAFAAEGTASVRLRRGNFYSRRNTSGFAPAATEKCSAAIAERDVTTPALALTAVTAGATTHTYSIVPRTALGAGRQTKAYSTTSVASLNATDKITLTWQPAFGGTGGCVGYDVLKLSGATWKLLGTTGAAGTTTLVDSGQTLTTWAPTFYRVKFRDFLEAQDGSDLRLDPTDTFAKGHGVDISALPGIDIARLTKLGVTVGAGVDPGATDDILLRTVPTS